MRSADTPCRKRTWQIAVRQVRRWPKLPDPRTRRILRNSGDGALPPGQGLANLETEFEGDNVGEAKIEGTGGSIFTRAIGPAVQEQLAIAERNVEHDRWCDLKGQTGAETRHRTPGVEPPLVPVDRTSHRGGEIRRQPRDPCQVHAELGAELLQDGEAQQVGGVLPGELVRSAEVPRTARAIA